MTDAAPARLTDLVGRLETLARRRLDLGPRGPAALARARTLAEHIGGHLRVRAASLEAPLLVLLLGPTGAGKSTLFNTLVGRPASQTGVLRPTTREVVVLVHPVDRIPLLEGSLAGIAEDRLRLVVDDTVEPGLALADAPDIDSIEHANREVADRLVEAADLCLFVTTATRYADQVPWTVLGRVRDRGLPLMVVVNRLPADAGQRDEVLADVDRLVRASGLAPDGVAPAIVGVPEGATDPGREALAPEGVTAVADEIARLRGDREARVALAARALAGSLAGLADGLDRIADDSDHEAIDVEAVRRSARNAYEGTLDALRQELRQGTFLREEALRHWQAFVGADQVTRFFSQGIGRIRGAIAQMIRPATAPIAEVRAATTDDLLAVARLQAAEAARRAAGTLVDDPAIGPAIADDPTLWGATDDFDVRLRARLEAWIEGIVTDIQTTGGSKRLLARGASIGVNALGTGVMLGTFVHTGGLTGAEVGVAAATAFLNQKLLSALFGEAAMVELVDRARRRLDEALTETWTEERDRFDRLLPPTGELPALATDLRSAAAEVRALTRAPA